MTAVVRVGDTVHRTAGPWTPTIHRLLLHLRARGFAAVPRPLGTTDDGRTEVLTYVPGTVPQYPMPAWVWTDAVLIAAAVQLAAFHEAGSDFDTAGARWQLPSHSPPEVVCHNDFAPYNLVFDERHEIGGVIDCDTASPGPRAWDLAYLAYLAYRLVPLGRPDDSDASDAGGDLAERRRRLALLCRAYGHDLESAAVAAMAVPRLRELAELAAARASPPRFRTHVQRYRGDADRLEAHVQESA